MASERRAFERRTLSYRLGHFLVQLSERRWTRLLVSVVLGIAGGVVEVIAYQVFQFLPSRELVWLGHAFVVSSFVFLLTYVELSVVRERRVRVVREIAVLANLNHHIRNALVAIQYAAYTSQDKRNIELITASIERIDRILKDLYPALGVRDESIGRTQKLI